MTDDHKDHDSQIVDQFTRQVDVFLEKVASQETALRLLLEVTGVSADDTVLDVACGPGVVACAFAAVARHATGVDITPAMIERAERLQAEKGLANMEWIVADVETLPYADDTFSLVFSRYTFHHLVRPGRVLAEMKRVCRPGGTVALIDVAPAADKVDAFNRMETLRDPSHVRAMPPAELLGMMRDASLTPVKTESYLSETELEKQLRSSFPEPGSEAQLRQIFMDDLTTDALGMGTHRRDGDIYVGYPTLMIVARKAD